MGEYQLFPGHVYQVSLIDGRLMWSRGKTPRVELVPEDDHTFVLNGREFYRVRFEANAQGRVTHMRVIAFPGVEYSAPRLLSK